MLFRKRTGKAPENSLSFGFLTSNHDSHATLLSCARSRSTHKLIKRSTCGKGSTATQQAAATTNCSLTGSILATPLMLTKISLDGPRAATGRCLFSNCWLSFDVDRKLKPCARTSLCSAYETCLALAAVTNRSDGSQPLTTSAVLVVHHFLALLMQTSLHTQSPRLLRCSLGSSKLVNRAFGAKHSAAQQRRHACKNLYRTLRAAMTSVAQSGQTQSGLQAGPRQMLQLEDYTLPAWAYALSANVRNLSLLQLLQLFCCLDCAFMLAEGTQEEVCTGHFPNTNT